jgi:dTMP kinase
MRGKFITIEGCEGVGKSTNIAFARALLEARGIPLRVTREPGGTPLAEDIRRLLLAHREETMCDATELLLVFAARAQHTRSLIEPALARGEWVLCDRFTDATIAYQGGGRGIDGELILALKRLVLGAFEPDLTLLLDLPVEAGMARIRARGALDRFEEQDLTFFRRVRKAYLELAEASPARIRVIDAGRALAAVQSDIEAALSAYVDANGGEARAGG